MNQNGEMDPEPQAAKAEYTLLVKEAADHPQTFTSEKHARACSLLSRIQCALNLRGEPIPASSEAVVFGHDVESRNAARCLWSPRAAAGENTRKALAEARAKLAKYPKPWLTTEDNARFAEKLKARLDELQRGLRQQVEFEEKLKDLQAHRPELVDDLVGKGVADVRDQ